jgi:hypothetical protein
VGALVVGMFVGRIVGAIVVGGSVVGADVGLLEKMQLLVDVPGGLINPGKQTHAYVDVPVTAQSVVDTSQPWSAVVHGCGGMVGADVVGRDVGALDAGKQQHSLTTPGNGSFKGGKKMVGWWWWWGGGGGYQCDMCQAVVVNYYWEGSGRLSCSCRCDSGGHWQQQRYDSATVCVRVCVCGGGGGVPPNCALVHGVLDVPAWGVA